MPAASVSAPSFSSMSAFARRSPLNSRFADTAYPPSDDVPLEDEPPDVALLSASTTAALFTDLLPDAFKSPL